MGAALAGADTDFYRRSLISNPPKIPLVENDDFAATVVAETLFSVYDVRHVDTAQAALNLLAERANAHVVALDRGAAVAREHAALTQLTASTREALQSIDQRHRDQGIKNHQIFQDLQTNFDRSMLTLGVTQSQEEERDNMLQNAANQARSLYDEGLEAAHTWEIFSNSLRVLATKRRGNRHVNATPERIRQPLT